MSVAEEVFMLLLLVIDLPCAFLYDRNLRHIDHEKESEIIQNDYRANNRYKVWSNLIRR